VHRDDSWLLLRRLYRRDVKDVRVILRLFLRHFLLLLRSGLDLELFASLLFGWLVHWILE
jgi:hypothetical protein